METHSRVPALSYFLLFLPPFFWSTNFIVGKALADTVPPWTLNLGRFAVSSLILIPWITYRREWKKIPRRFLIPLFLMSLTGVSAFNSVLYIGLHHTTAINATLVNATSPLTTACLAWILIGERMTGRQLFGVLVSVAGISFIVSRGSLENLSRLDLNRGDILVFFATALWGFYSVMAKPLMAELSPRLLTAITTGLGTLFLLPAPFLELAPAERVALVTPEALLAFLYLGIFPSFVSFLLWNRSILVFGPGRASLVYNTLPLFAAFLSVTLLGEPLRAYQIVGGTIAILGVILGTTGRAS